MVDVLPTKGGSRKRKGNRSAPPSQRRQQPAQPGPATQPAPADNDLEAQLNRSSLASQALSELSQLSTYAPAEVAAHAGSLALDGDAAEIDWKAVAASVNRAIQSWQRLGPIERRERKAAEAAFSDALDLLRQADRMQRSFFSVPLGRSQPSFEPPVDIVERRGVLLIRVALPGVESKYQPSPAALSSRVMSAESGFNPRSNVIDPVLAKVPAASAPTSRSKLNVLRPPKPLALSAAARSPGAFCAGGATAFDR